MLSPLAHFNNLRGVTPHPFLFKMPFVVFTSSRLNILTSSHHCPLITEYYPLNTNHLQSFSLFTAHSSLKKLYLCRKI